MYIFDINLRPMFPVKLWRNPIVTAIAMVHAQYWGMNDSFWIQTWSQTSTLHTSPPKPQTTECGFKSGSKCSHPWHPLAPHLSCVEIKIPSSGSHHKTGITMILEVLECFTIMDLLVIGSVFCLLPPFSSKHLQYDARSRPAAVAKRSRLSQ